MDNLGMKRAEWRELVESLEEVGADYEKMNSLMTFGLVDKWRRRVAALAAEDDVVLEIGPGPGYFTRHLKSHTIYCLEPSLRFAKSVKDVLDPCRVTLLKGVAERIPLADNTVDKVFCMFSFRDFFDRPAALSEMNRVLREGGEAVIADVARPESGPLAKMLEMHFRALVPVLARVAISPSSREVWARDPYSKLLDTWLAYGSPSENEKLMRERGFSEVSTEYLELKGATMTRGKKPWKSTS
jgi:demethylmenaquinone methyltransferase/2-methoxy-6-polyprenyl-1,4-benzoquinol methylase